jgi:hypothetical protein
VDVTRGGVLHHAPQPGPERPGAEVAAGRRDRAEPGPVTGLAGKGALDRSVIADLLRAGGELDAQEPNLCPPRLWSHEARKQPTT